MVSQERKTVLMLTHNYPRFKGCAMAPFVGVLVENLAKHCNMIVLSPWHKWAVSERNGVKLEYFRYSFKAWEKLSYTGNLFAKIRGIKPHYQFLGFCYLISYVIKCLTIAIREKPDIIHSQWFVPSGLVGHITSLLTGIPHIVTVHSDSFLVKKNKILRFIARVIFKRAKVVIAVSQSVKEHVVDIAPRIKVIYPCNQMF
jgi:hypothetical protein